MPVFFENNFRNTHMIGMEELSPTTSTMSIAFNYSPISISKLRLLMHAERAIRFQLRPLGFSNRDEDEVKAFLSDNNVYLLCGAIFVGGIHVSMTSLAIEERTIISLTFVSGSFRIFII